MPVAALTLEPARMKFLKIAAIVVVVLIVAVVGIAYLIPSQVHVERTIEISAPAEQVFANVNDLKKWETWSPWYAAEPDAKYDYSGADSGVGAKVAWDGKIVGKGTQEITRSEQNSRIETELDFMEQGKATAFWTFDESGGLTKVTWGFDTDMGMNPVARYFGLVMDSMLGPDYEKGLAKLKEVCESPGTESAVN
jgi:ribosome-associated toxin RatA of RatAB toxin-antitoxin module